jgi:hypothetical protein
MASPYLWVWKAILPFFGEKPHAFGFICREKKK